MVNRAREWGTGTKEWDKLEVEMAGVRPAAELDSCLFCLSPRSQGDLAVIHRECCSGFKRRKLYAHMVMLHSKAKLK